MDKNYFSTRTSVRNFQKKGIPDNIIEYILETAMRAPTCGNMQLYSVIVTRNQEMKKKLEKYHFCQPASTGCDVILTICADFNRFSNWCRISGANPGYNNFHSFIMAMTDAVIYAQQIVTIAESEGIGTCYLGTVNYNASEIGELLKLPELVVPVASIALGYPEGEPERVERLPLRAIMHSEQYRHDSEQDIINQFKDKEDFEANKKFVAENTKDCLAAVFTDIRYPKDLNEAVSKSFMSLLEEKGYLTRH